MCTAPWYQIHSHCCGIKYTHIPIIYLQNSFSSRETETMAPLNNIPFCPAPRPQQPPLTLGSSVHQIIHYLPFCHWFISFSITPSGFIHVVVNARDFNGRKFHCNHGLIIILVRYGLDTLKNQLQSDEVILVYKVLKLHSKTLRGENILT